MPDRRRGSNKNDNLRNTDNQDTMYIPNDSPEYQQNAQQYAEQYYGGQPEYPQQQYYDPQTQYYDPQQGYPQQPQYYDQQQGYPQQPQYYDQQQQFYQQEPQPYYPDQGGGYAPPPPMPPAGGRKSSSNKKRKKKKHKSLTGKIIRRVIFSLLILFLILFGIYSCTSLAVIRKINYVEDGDRTRNDDAISRSYVTSVLIIGTDGRSDDDRGRSDSMILVSFNSKTNETTLTSFLRDSYVEIPEYGWGKLNWAYSYGGAELLMDTIEGNFDVRIDNYISVNFVTFASIIDAAGGIDMEITDDEANEINVILRNEVNEIMGDAPNADFVPNGGNVHLSGKQALCYSRIRYVGKSDFERTSRQRRVITALIKKAAKKGPSFIKEVSDSAMPHLTTNMPTGKLYLLSLKLPFALRYDTKQIQIPAEGTYSGEDVYDNDGFAQSVLKVDFDANYEIIEEEIFSK